MANKSASTRPRPGRAHFDALVFYLRAEIPLRIRYKDQSRRMRALNRLMRFLLPTFMTHYATTWAIRCISRVSNT
ncbi:MAG: hypothetical protein HC913_22995 [Microscillaceae bacterium]|nr:hypothetical protein [Microscillaceae bacterium]